MVSKYRNKRYVPKHLTSLQTCTHACMHTRTHAHTHTHTQLQMDLLHQNWRRCSAALWVLTFSHLPVHSWAAGHRTQSVSWSFSPGGSPSNTASQPEGTKGQTSHLEDCHLKLQCKTTDRLNLPAINNGHTNIEESVFHCWNFWLAL